MTPNNALEILRKRLMKNPELKKEYIKEKRKYQKKIDRKNRRKNLIIDDLAQS